MKHSLDDAVSKIRTMAIRNGDTPFLSKYNYEKPFRYYIYFCSRLYGILCVC